MQEVAGQFSTSNSSRLYKGAARQWAMPRRVIFSPIHDCWVSAVLDSSGATWLSRRADQCPHFLPKSVNHIRQTGTPGRLGHQPASRIGEGLASIATPVRSITHSLLHRHPSARFALFHQFQRAQTVRSIAGPIRPPQ